MANEMMTLSEFRDLIDRYGPEPAGWPSAAASIATALVAADAAAAAEQAAARRVATLLKQATLPAPVDAALVGRVLARARGERRPHESIFRLTPRLAFAGMTGLAMCLVVGVAIGLVAPPPAAADGGDDLAVLVLGVEDGTDGTASDGLSGGGVPGDFL